MVHDLAALRHARNLVMTQAIILLCIILSSIFFDARIAMWYMMFTVLECALISAILAFANEIEDSKKVLVTFTISLALSALSLAITPWISFAAEVLEFIFFLLLFYVVLAEVKAVTK